MSSLPRLSSPSSVDDAIRQLGGDAEPELTAVEPGVPTTRPVEPIAPADPSPGVPVDAPRRARVAPGLQAPLRADAVGMPGALKQPTGFDAHHTHFYRVEPPEPGGGSPNADGVVAPRPIPVHELMPARSLVPLAGPEPGPEREPPAAAALEPVRPPASSLAAPSVESSLAALGMGRLGPGEFAEMPAPVGGEGSAAPAEPLAPTGTTPTGPPTPDAQGPRSVAPVTSPPAPIATLVAPPPSAPASQLAPSAPARQPVVPTADLDVPGPSRTASVPAPPAPAAFAPASAPPAPAAFAPSAPAPAPPRTEPEPEPAPRALTPLREAAATFTSEPVPPQRRYSAGWSEPGGAQTSAAATVPAFPELPAPPPVGAPPRDGLAVAPAIVSARPASVPAPLSATPAATAGPPAADLPPAPGLRASTPAAPEPRRFSFGAFRPVPAPDGVAEAAPSPRELLRASTQRAVERLMGPEPSISFERQPFTVATEAPTTASPTARPSIAELTRQVEQAVLGGQRAAVYQREVEQKTREVAAGILAEATTEAQRSLESAEAEAEAMLASARAEADQLVADGRAEADQLVADAHTAHAASVARGESHARAIVARADVELGRRIRRIAELTDGITAVAEATEQQLSAGMLTAPQLAQFITALSTVTDRALEHVEQAEHVAGSAASAPAYAGGSDRLTENGTTHADA